LWIVLVAMGDSLLGAEMAESLGLGRERAREIVRHLLLASTGLGGAKP
jgi:hypothetical protein